MSWREFCLEACRKHRLVMESVSHDTVPQHSSILPSEMLAFCSVAKELRVSQVIESGRKLGYSTEFIARCHFGKFISIEMEPLEEKDAELRERLNGIPCGLKTGKAFMKIPDYIQGGTALLLDGPKGPPALKVAKQHAAKCSVWAIHDVNPSCPGIRQSMVENGAFFTDDPEFLEEFGSIDRGMLEYRGYNHHGDLLPEANVLGIVRGGFGV